MIQLGIILYDKIANKEDLSENPVAEEPNYRLRVIWAMPSLQVLDRHGKIVYKYVVNLLVVTLEERTKAKAWYTAEVKGIQPAKKPKKANGWQASQGIFF